MVGLTGADTSGVRLRRLMRIAETEIWKVFMIPSRGILFYNGGRCMGKVVL
jgi:hypothetical protein